MEQDNVLEKVERKYNNKSNQVAKVNQTTIISLTFIELLLVFAMVIQTFVYETALGKLGIIPMIILIIGIIANWICYLKDKKSEKLRYYMFAGFILGWIYLMVLGTNVMVSFYIYPLVISTILYHDRKLEKILFYSILATTLIRTVAWGISGQLLSGDMISLISIIIHLEIVIVLHTISKLSSMFTEDMLCSVQDEQKMQDLVQQLEKYQK